MFSEEKEQPIKYGYHKEIRSSLKTGDIVLFSGDKGIAPLIKFFTRSIWSHVGMVYVRDGDVCLWESTKIGKVVDSEIGNIVNGVQLPLLSERIRTFPGNVAIRSISEGFEQDMLQKLSTFRERVKGRKYDGAPLTLLLSVYDGIFIPEGFVLEASNDLSSFFCSELIAETYREVGLFFSQQPASEYTPADFAEDGKFSLNGRTFGKETYVEWDDPT